MKNPNNYGSVLKLSGRRRKPFAVRVTTCWIQNFDDNGLPIGNPKQIRKYIGYYATRREALSALAKFNSESEKARNEGIITETHDTPRIASKRPYVPTLAQHWAQVRNMKKNALSAVTLYNYDTSFKRCEALHNKRIDLITYPELQRVMNAYMDEGKTLGSLRLFKAFLSIVFGEAVKCGYILQSPAQFVTYKATKDKRKKHALSHETIERVKASNARTRSTVLILLYTGMRIEELLSVRPEAIDFEHHYLIGGSKTEAGKNRIIPIHPDIQPIMKEWLNESIPGSCRIRELLKRDCEEAYGTSFTLHECRHTFITAAQKSGIPLPVIKKIVGHAQGSVTEDVYTHFDSEYLYEEIQKLRL